MYVSPIHLQVLTRFHLVLTQKEVSQLGFHFFHDIFSLFELGHVVNLLFGNVLGVLGSDFGQFTVHIGQIIKLSLSYFLRGPKLTEHRKFHITAGSTPSRQFPFRLD